VGSAQRGDAWKGAATVNERREGQSG
jgi:hypothetical protein